MRRLSSLLVIAVTAACLLPFVGTARVEAAKGVAINSTNFPDPNFRAIVASATYDKDQDGYISDYEGTHVNNMHCENSNIYSLKGIEFFPGITGLWCLNNNISSWDLSRNTNLVGIWCSKNPFTELDFTGLPNLEWVYCFECDLHSLNVRNNPKLAYLECNSNPNLGSLDLSQNHQLENLFASKCGLTSLDVSGCPLMCELNAQENDLRSIDLSHNPEMRRLDIWDNENLGNIDVSNMPKLQLLNVGNINCSRLDVTHNPELQALFANYNEELRTLDLSQNPKLADLRLECDWRLTSLDISHNPKLYYVLAFGLLGIPSLDISHNPHLQITYNNGFVNDETHLGNVHSYNIELGGSDEYFADLSHCLCVDNGRDIIAGSRLGTIAPDSFIDTNDGHSSSERFATRGEAVLKLYESAGSPAVQRNSRFTDVAGTRYEAAVVWAETYNICFGYPITCSYTFCPDELISREDFALMAHRAALYIGAGTALDYGRTDWYDDALDIDYYGWGAFTWAMQFEVLKPVGNKCYPHGRVTLAEMNAGVNKISNLDEAASYSDRVGANGQGIGASPEIVTYADGTISGTEPTFNFTPVTEQGIGGFVERLYTVALGRASDPAGKADWINRVTNQGYTGADVAEGFLYSDEFLSKNMSNSQFLDILYATFFNRAADTGGKNNWLNAMAAGMSKREVIRGFIDSTEWANLCLTYGILSGGNGVPNITIEPSDEVRAFVTRLYSTCLGRDGDPWGMNDWSSQLANMRISGSVCAHGFFFSDEFIGQNLSNDEYVLRLYRTFMNREPDPAGFADWTGRLAAGASREDVFQGFAGSAEWALICADYGIIK